MVTQQTETKKYFTTPLAALVVGLGVFFIFTPQSASAATKTYEGGGGCGTGSNAYASCPNNWSSNTLPVNGDTIIFNENNGIDFQWDNNTYGTLPTSIAALTITIGTNNTFAINKSLTVTGATVFASAAGTPPITLSSGISLSTSTLQVGTNVQFTNSGTLTLTCNSCTPVSGSGTFTTSASTATVVYSGTSTTIHNTTYKNLTISGSVTNTANATVSGVFGGAGTFNPSAGTITFNNGASITQSNLSFFNITLASSASVTYSVSFTVKGTLTTNSGVNFTYTGTPNVTFNNGAAIVGTTGVLKFYDFTTPASSTVTFPRGITVNHNFTIGSGATYNGGITLEGGTIVATTGTINTPHGLAGSTGGGTINSNVTSSGGIATNNGALSISSGVTVTVTGGTTNWSNSAISGAGTLIIQGGTMTSSPNVTCSLIFDAVNSNLTIPHAGSSEDSFGAVTIRNSGSSARTIYFDGNGSLGPQSYSSSLTVTTTGSGTLHLDADTNNVTIFNITGNFTTGPVNGAVTISMGSANWTVSGNFDLSNVTTLNHNSGTLTMSGTGTLTSNGKTLNNFTTSGTGTVTLANATHTLEGNLTLGSTSTLSVGTSTIVMSGTSKTIAGNSKTLNNLTISGTITSTSGFAVSGSFAISSNATFTPAAADVISGAGTIRGPGTAKVTRTAATADFANQYTITTKTLTGANGLIVDYAGTGQVLTNTTYGDSSGGGLVVSGSISTGTNTATVGKTMTVSGTFTPSGGTLTFTGSGTKLSVSGTFAPTTAHTTVYGCTGACDLATATYYHLTINSPGVTVTSVGGDQTVNGNLYFQAGTNSRAGTGCNGFGCSFFVQGAGTSVTVDSGFTLTESIRGMYFGGSGTHDITMNGSGGFGMLNVGWDNSNPTVRLLTNVFAGWGTTVGTASASSGTLNLNGFTFTNGGDMTVDVGGTFQNTSGTLYLTGAFGPRVWTDNTAALQNFGSVQVATTGGTLRLGSNIKTTTIQVMGGTFALNSKDLTITDGGLSGSGTVYCAATDNSCSAGSTTITGTGSLGGSGSTFTFYTLSIGGSSATTTFTGNIETKGAFWCSGSAHVCDTGSNYSLTTAQFQVFSSAGESNAIFNANASAINVSGLFFAASVFNSAAKGTFNGEDSTITMSGTHATAMFWTMGTGTINLNTASDHTTVIYSNTSGTVPMYNTSYYNLTISGTITNGNSATVTNTFSNTGTFTPASGTITMSGGSISNSGTLTFNNLTIASGTTTTTSSFTIAGTLTTTGTLTASSASTITMNNGSSAVSAAGTLTFFNLTIPNSAAVTVDMNANVSGLLSVGSSATLTINTGDTLTLSGNSGTTLTLTGTIGGSGTLIYQNSATTFPTTGTISSALILDTLNGNLTIPSRTFGGAVTGRNTTASARQLIFGSSVTPTFSSGLTLTTTSTGTLLLDGATNNPTTVTVTGNFTVTPVNGAVTVSMGSGTWSVSGNFDLTNVTTFNHNSGTLTMSGTGTLTSNGKTLNNLTTSGSGTVTLANAAHTLAGNLTLGSSSTFTMGSATPSVGGNVTLAGTVNANTSTLTMTGASKVLTGGGKTLTNLTISNTSGTITLQTSDLTVSSVLTVSGSGGSLTLDTGRTLTLSSSGTPLVVTGSITAAGSTVIYTGTSAINVASGITYGNLTLGTAATGAARTWTLGSGTTTVSGLLTLNTPSSGTNTFDVSSRTLTLSGSGTPLVTNSQTITTTSSTINYTGTSATNIVGGITYATLNLGTAATAAARTWTLGSGTTTVSSVLTLNTPSSGTNTFDISSRTLTLSGSGTPLVTNSQTITATGSTVNYTGNSDTNIAATTYATLNLGTAATGAARTWTLGSGTTTVSGVLTINTPSSGTNTFDISSRTLTLSGSGTPLIMNSQSFTSTGSTVNYTGTSATNVSGLTYNILNLGTASTGAARTWTPNGNLTVGGVLTLNTPSSGTNTFDISNLTLTLSGSGTPLVTNSQTITTTGSTVNYTGTSATNIAGGISYETLNLGTAATGAARTWTLGSGTTTVGGVLTLNTPSSGTNTFDITNQTITLSSSGTPLVTNGQNITSTGSTVNYTGTSATNVVGTTYATLNLGTASTGAARTYTLAADATVSNVLTVNVPSSGNNTLDISNRTLTLSGSGTPLILNGSTVFTTTDSTVAYTGSGTVNVAGLSGYNNLTLNNGAGSFVPTNNITTAGDLTITAGILSLDEKNVTVNGGDFNNSGTVYCGNVSNTCSTGTVIVSGSGNVGGSGTTTFFDLTAGAGSTGTTTAGGNFTVKGVMNVATAQTFDASSRTITLSGTSGPLLTLTGTGTFNGNTSTVVISPNASITIFSGSPTFYNLQLSPTLSSTGKTYTLGGAVTITNNFDINPTAASALALTVNLSGTTAVTGTTTITRTSSATSVVDTSSASNYALTSGAINVAAGATLLGNTSTITLTGTSGTLFTLNASGTFTPGNSTVVVNSDAGTAIAPLTLTSGAITFKNLSLTPTLGTVDRYYTFGTGEITVSGNLNLNPSASTTTKNLTVKLGDTLNVTGAVALSGTSTGVSTLDTTLSGDHSLSATSITINTGSTLNARGSSVTLTGNGTPLVNNGTLSGTSASNFVYQSAATSGTTVTSLAYPGSLTLNKASNTFTASAGTLSLGNDLAVTAGTFNLDTNDAVTTVADDLTIDGTLVASATAALTLKGDWTNNGTFTASNGTVTISSDEIVANVLLTPTTSLTGSSTTTFANLTSTTPGKTLSFLAGSSPSFVVTGNLTLQGTSPRPIRVQSATPGSQWFLFLNSTPTEGSLAHLLVRDSGCSVGTADVGTGEDITSLGNNGTCWNFRFLNSGGVLGGGTGSGASGEAFSGQALVGYEEPISGTITAAAGQIIFFRFTGITTGTGTRIFLRTGGVSATSIKLGLYTNSGSSPSTLVSNSTCTLSSPAVGWRSCAATPSVTAGTVYWLAVLPIGGSIDINATAPSGTSVTSVSTSQTDMPASAPSLNGTGSTLGDIVLRGTEDITGGGTNQGGGGFGDSP